MTEEQKARLAELESIDIVEWGRTATWEMMKEREYLMNLRDEEEVAALDPNNYWKTYFHELEKKKEQWVDDRIEVWHDLETDTYDVTLKIVDFNTPQEARAFALGLFNEFLGKFYRGPIG